MAIIKKESAGGLILCDGRYLLIHDLDTRQYETPKGSIEPQESREDACVREVREETGYSAKVVTFLHTTRFLLDWKDGKTYDKTIHYYLLELTDKNQVPYPQREADENFENVWASYEEAKTLLTHEDTKKALDLAQAYSDDTQLSTSVK